ncbi:MAG: 30S ribosomal protein S18 [Finegoldia sp.]|nr:30S ribosomal protein S18 [Finegoldia sp.]
MQNRRYRPRKKVDPFQKDKSKVIDYKDVNLLKNYISDRGKILPRRVTGLNAKHQRQITDAIKKARQVALLPYSND